MSKPPVSNEEITVTQVGTPSSQTAIYIYADVLEELKYTASQRDARGMLVGIHHEIPPQVRTLCFDAHGDITEASKSSAALESGCTVDDDNPPVETCETESAKLPEKQKKNRDLGEDDESKGMSQAPLSDEDNTTPNKPENDDATNETKKDVDFVEITAFKDIYPVEDALDYGMYLRRQRNFRSPQEKQTVVGSVVVSIQPWKIAFEDLLLQRTYWSAEWQIALFVDTEDAPPRVFYLTHESAQLAETGYYVISLKDAPLPFKI